MKAEWRSVSRDSGVQCVMIYGALMMLEWLVDNWDIHQQVNINQSKTRLQIMFLI